MRGFQVSGNSLITYQPDYSDFDKDYWLTTINDWLVRAEEEKKYEWTITTIFRFFTGEASASKEILELTRLKSMVNEITPESTTKQYESIFKQCKHMIKEGIYSLKWPLINLANLVLGQMKTLQASENPAEASGIKMKKL